MKYLILFAFLISSAFGQPTLANSDDISGLQGQIDDKLDPTDLSTTGTITPKTGDLDLNNIGANDTPALYHDFSQHPDNTVLSLGSLPDIGNKHQWSSESGIAPVIADGGLRGANDDLYYFGHDVGETIKSISFEQEYVGDGSGGGNIGVTYAFHSVPLLEDDGYGLPGLAVPNMLHVEMNQSGISKFGFSETGGVNFEIMQPMGIAQTGDGSTPFSNNVAGGSLGGLGRHVVKFAFHGADCVVTILGKSWVFRHPPAKGTATFSGTPSNGDTTTVGSVVYTWKNTLASGNDIKIGASAADCVTNFVAALNAASGSGTLYGTGTVMNPLVRGAYPTSTQITFEARLAGPGGNSIAIAKSASNITLSGSTLAGGERTPISAMGAPRYYWFENEYKPAAYYGSARLYRVWANAPAYDHIAQENIISKLSTTGKVTLPQELTFSAAAAFSSGVAVAGNVSATGYLSAAQGGSVQYRTPLTTATHGLVVASNGTTNQTLGSLLGAQMGTVGDSEEIVWHGFTGANANNKKWRFEAQGTLVWESINLPLNLEIWTLRITRYFTGTGAGVPVKYVIEFDSSTTKYRHIEYMATSYAAPLTHTLKCTTTAASDIQVIGGRCVAFIK